LQIEGPKLKLFKAFCKNFHSIESKAFRSLYFGYETGHFSQFQTQGVITCIPKENKDRRYMSNWRPISLLNTDLKIASAAIANRFKQVFRVYIKSFKPFANRRTKIKTI
jgi:hypothetical protein